MKIVEINTILQKDNKTSWVGKLYECSYKNVVEYDENDNEILVERLTHDSLEDTHNFEVNEPKTIEDIQQITKEYYGL